MFERCILVIETAIYFDPNARRFTKLEPNDFAISREPFDEIDSNFFYFKGMDPIGPERTKISEVGAE